MKKSHALKCSLFIVLISLSTLSFAQKAPEKYGKISKKELEIQKCPIDSSAHAYYIFDFGNAYFKYASTHGRSDDPSSTDKGFQIIFEHHFRIKILDNEGFDWANFEIPLYHSDGNEEQITSIKGRTYNLVDGKIEKTKLKWNDVLEEESSANWTTSKFAMPNVRAGSVIEVDYTITSDFPYNFREWSFQKFIPVLQSDYYVALPEYYGYNQTQKGYFPIAIEHSQTARDLTITFEQKAEGTTRQGYTSKNTFSYLEDTYFFHAKDIPAFPMEKYLKTADNYITKIEFELLYTKYPNAPIRHYTTSWEKINENLLDHTYFGKELERNGHLKDDVLFLKNSGLEGPQLINAAFSFMKSKLIWNGGYDKYTTESLRKAYKNKGGNSADINLNLVAMLRELGFDAYPVLLSTQKHGAVHPAHPSSSSFNYVIAMVQLDGKNYLMDATDPTSLTNTLPTRCLNDKGRIVNNGGGSWIDLNSEKTKYMLVETKKLSINDDLQLVGTTDVRMKDYSAYQFRKKDTDNKDYKESLEKANKGLHLHNLNIEGQDSLHKAINISYELTQDSYIEKTNDLMFFSPAYMAFVDECPFKLEKREYPIEYNYPYTVQQIISISIPEGYTVSEIPKPLIVQTPDKSAKYIYNISHLGNSINLTLMFSINKTMFLPEEYEILKNFYTMILDKQNELVVLKASE